MSVPPTVDAELDLDEMVQRITAQLDGPVTEETALKLADATLRLGDIASAILRQVTARLYGGASDGEQQPVEERAEGEGAIAPSPLPPSPHESERKAIPCPACGAPDGVQVSTLLVNVRGKRKRAGEKGEPASDGCVDASTWTCPACGAGGSREDYQRLRAETPDQRRRRRIGELYPEYADDEGYRRLWLDSLSITEAQAKKLTSEQIAAMRRFLDELIDAKQHGDFPPTPPAKARRLETVDARRLQ